MAEGTRDNIQYQTAELLHLHQSIIKAWNKGLGDDEAARVLDELVQCYQDVVAVLSGENEKAWDEVQEAVNQVVASATNVWDKLANSKKDEAWKAVKRPDIPVSLREAGHIASDGDAKLAEAVKFDGDIKCLCLYEKAVDKYEKAFKEVLLVRDTSQGLQSTVQSQIKLGRGQIILTIISTIIATAIAIGTVLFVHK